MPFRKLANAMVTHPRITGRGWSGVRRIASSGASTRNLTDQAREILGGPLDPDRYLFTHCTIVASVDTDPVPGAKLGKVKVGSRTVDRRYADFHIKPESSPFVNNNGDSWSREVLLASYPSFIGSHNFQEHVQQEEKSKGRILDAVARDIGDSVYVDILVATNRKHAGLINDINSGNMGTLSMGCVTEFTICTKCGHYAVDETDLCDDIRYAKLNTFMDDNGKKRVIAELCGHIDYDETGGVQFIEASWVAVPAFPGAVMRNIMKTGELGMGESEIRKLLRAPAPSWSEQAISKAAKFQPRTGFGFGDEDEEGGDKEEAPAEPEAPFKDLEEDLYKHVKNRVVDRIKAEMREKAVEKTPAPPASDWPNDTLNKEAQHPQVVGDVTSVVEGRFHKGARARYANAVETLVRVASSDISLVDGYASINHSFGLRVAPRIYRAALKVGPSSKYATPEGHVRACRKASGRNLSIAELRVVVRVGTMLSRLESRNNPTVLVRSS